MLGRCRSARIFLLGVVTLIIVFLRCLRVLSLQELLIFAQIVLLQPFRDVASDLRCTVVSLFAVDIGMGPVQVEIHTHRYIHRLAEGGEIRPTSLALLVEVGIKHVSERFVSEGELASLAGGIRRIQMECATCIHL